MNYGDRPLNIPPEEDGTPHTPRAVQAVTEVGLPSLRGEEADLQTAREVRLDKLIAADDVLTELRVGEQQTELGRMSSELPPEPVTKSMVQAAQIALDSLRHQDDAAWWLANRERTARELIEMFTSGLTLPLTDSAG